MSFINCMLISVIIKRKHRIERRVYAYKNTDLQEMTTYNVLEEGLSKKIIVNFLFYTLPSFLSLFILYFLI